MRTLMPERSPERGDEIGDAEAAVDQFIAPFELPVAANEREIDGHASDRSMPLTVPRSRASSDRREHRP